MSIEAIQIHPLFCAEVRGVQVCEPMQPETFNQIQSAFDDYSVLVFRDQRISDEGQIAFTERFGPLERTVKGNATGGSLFARQSNLDAVTGEVIPADDKRLSYVKVTRRWHTDSSYKPVPALCSILSGRVVPEEGGNTEFSTCRAAYDDLSQATRERIDRLYAVHSHMHTLMMVDASIITDEMLNEYSPVRHPLVRTNPTNGRKAIYAGSHAFGVMGVPPEAGGQLLKELADQIGSDKYVYRHAWRAGDIVMWDNRAVQHRSTAYDTARYKRLLQRTTAASREDDYRVEAKQFLLGLH